MTLRKVQLNSHSSARVAQHAAEGHEQAAVDDVRQPGRRRLPRRDRPDDHLAADLTRARCQARGAWHRVSSARLVEAPGDLVPVDDVPPRGEVVRAAVLVVEVVGVLPDVDAEERTSRRPSAGCPGSASTSTARPLPSQTSQVQPEPNRFTPASLSCAFSCVGVAERVARSRPRARRTGRRRRRAS